MTDSQMEELVAAVRALPSEERLRVAQRVIEALPPDDRLRVVQKAAQADAPTGARAVPAMLGLFADEPDLVDQVCRQAYAERAIAKPRQLDDE